eukprot:TRINITY_DN44485_c0_g1_i1.p1 TRINITY_DN44485_c0_g1~~TRINITY_DN44485_c0_g1_i1.p1  ORF type:complete len:599 (-),score=41.03 TRINITY_DN44485_c0_g1_i1:284-2050(-)
MDCWAGGFSAAFCCDLSKGPRGDTSCWDKFYTFQSCCPPSPASAQLPPASKLIDDLRLWPDTGEVGQIATAIWPCFMSIYERQAGGFPALDWRVVTWPLQDTVFYVASQHVGTTTTRHVGSILAPRSCPSNLIHDVLIPLNLKHMGLLNPEAHVSSEVSRAKPSIIPSSSWWRLVAFLALAPAASVLPWVKPHRRRRARNVAENNGGVVVKSSATSRQPGIDLLRVLATGVLIAFHISMVWRFDGPFPAATALQILGEDASTAIFSVLSATILEDSIVLQDVVKTSTWEILCSLVGRILRKWVRLGLPLVFHAALATSVYAWRAERMNPFVYMGRFPLTWYTETCLTHVERNGIFTDLHGRISDWSFEPNQCGQWFFTVELRAWTCSFILLVITRLSLPSWGGTMRWEITELVALIAVACYAVAAQHAFYDYFFTALTTAQVSRRLLNVGHRSRTEPTKVKGLEVFASVFLFAGFCLFAVARCHLESRIRIFFVLIVMLVTRFLQWFWLPSSQSLASQALGWLADHCAAVNLFHNVWLAFLASYQEILEKPTTLVFLKAFAAVVIPSFLMGVLVRHFIQDPAIRLLRL